MRPIDFPGVNLVIAKDQPEYLPLPVIYLEGGEVISCWELTDEEISNIIRNRCIFISQLTFNRALQPLLPATQIAEFFQVNSHNSAG